jgi:uncharacterized membrane protein
MTTMNMLLFLSALLSGLVAGLFYGYDCSVIKGLGKLNDKEYLSAFQSINKAILNPYFFVGFMGCLLLLPVATWVSFNQVPATCFYLLLSSTIVYMAAVFAVTIFGNVPLNEHMAAMDLSPLSETDISVVRKHFENKWNGFHRIRTIASVVSFALALLSIMFR